MIIDHFQKVSCDYILHFSLIPPNLPSFHPLISNILAEAVRDYINDREVRTPASSAALLLWRCRCLGDHLLRAPACWLCYTTHRLFICVQINLFQYLFLLFWQSAKCNKDPYSQYSITAAKCSLSICGTSIPEYSCIFILLILPRR